MELRPSAFAAAERERSYSIRSIEGCQMKTERIVVTSLLLIAILVAGCGKSTPPVTIQECKDRGGEICHDKCVDGDCSLFCKPVKGRIDYTKPLGECKIGSCPNPCR